MLILPMLLGAFQPPSQHLAEPPRSFPGAESKNCQHLAMSGGYIKILFSASWSKSSEQHGQDSTLGVLRLRAIKRCVAR